MDVVLFFSGLKGFGVHFALAYEHCKKPNWPINFFRKDYIMDNKGRRTNNGLEMTCVQKHDHIGRERRVVRIRRKTHREKPADRLNSFVF